jgi:hypothetical protein
VTPDGLPFIGESKILDGYLLAAGMCGQGFMLGPGTADLLTRLILNDLDEKDNRILSQLPIFFIISFLPPITQKPYSPENTQHVIIQLLIVAIKPYETFGILFHIATVILVGWIMVDSTASGRPLFIYMGVNFIIIALVQSFGTTELYGRVIHTGGLIAFTLIGVLWIWAGVKGGTEPLLTNIQWRHMLFMPFAVLAFWAPYQVKANMVLPDFNPALLLTSPDYGLSFCFTAPVFFILTINLVSKSKHTCIPHYCIQWFAVCIV